MDPHFLPLHASMGPCAREGSLSAQVSTGPPAARTAGKEGSSLLLATACSLQGTHQESP